MIQVLASDDPSLRRLLTNHPRVAAVSDAPASVALEWRAGARIRRIVVGRTDIELAGLPELIDNNPLVCADMYSAPSPGATLATIALGPLAAAGMIVEQPTLLSNVETDAEEVRNLLARLGWEGGSLIAVEAADLGEIFAVTAMCEVETPENLNDLDDVFEERYGRSFFVQKVDDWDVKSVSGQQRAVYRLRVTPDRPRSLLTIQVMADAKGKCGAGQIVHAFNVMAGFEESLGLQ